MLSALQGLLGQTVGVVIELHFNHRLRPLAALRGVLISGTPPTSRKDEGATLGYPEGESALFFVGDEHSWFVIGREDFKHGRRERGALLFDTGRVQTYIAPLPPE